jgi:hypothetical protein
MWCPEQGGWQTGVWWGPSPVMFDDLVGDPGHPSLLKCPALADRSLATRLS